MEALDVIKYLIVISSLIMAYAEIAQAVRLKGTSYAWIKWALGVMGLYWAGYYIRSILELQIGTTHQIWVRAPLLLTISFVASGAIMSLKRRVK